MTNIVKMRPRLQKINGQAVRAVIKAARCVVPFSVVVVQCCMYVVHWGSGYSCANK